MTAGQDGKTQVSSRRDHSTCCKEVLQKLAIGSLTAGGQDPGNGQQGTSVHRNNQAMDGSLTSEAGCDGPLHEMGNQAFGKEGPSCE